MKLSKIALHWQIMIALVLAAIMGSVTGTEGTLFGIHWMPVYVFIGALFLNALKMIVVPLVVSAIISGIGAIGDKGGFGRLGIKTLSYYLFTSFIAIMIGLLLVNAIQPGAVFYTYFRAHETPEYFGCRLLFGIKKMRK